MLRLIRLIFRSDLTGGIFFLALSFLPLLRKNAEYGLISSLAIASFFFIGVLLVSNFLTVSIGGFSLISSVRGKRRNNRHFIAVSATIGLLFSFITADLGGLWYYPHWSIASYYIIGFLLGGWAFYIMAIIASYEAVKLVLDRFIVQKRLVTKYYSFESSLYLLLFMVGLACMAVVVYGILKNTSFFQNFHYTVNSPKEPYLRWYYWILSFFGTVFICEFVEFKRKRSSLFKDTLHGYYNPLLAMFIVGFLMSMINEIQNFSVFLWKYNNYPMPDMTLLNVPLFVITVWPVQYIFFLEFWRAFGNRASDPIFANGKRYSGNQKLLRSLGSRRAVKRSVA